MDEMSCRTCKWYNSGECCNKELINILSETATLPEVINKYIEDGNLYHSIVESFEFTEVINKILNQLKPNLKKNSKIELDNDLLESEITELIDKCISDSLCVYFRNNQNIKENVKIANSNFSCKYWI